MRLAYLACPITLPGAKDRHPEGHLHDRMVAQLEAAVAERGGDMDVVSWDDEEVDPSDYDVGLIGTVWDYILRQDAFLTRMDQWAARGRLENPADLVRWNSDKRYLRQLAEADIEGIATVWLADPTEAAITSAFDLLQTNELVVKPQVGAGATGQHRLIRGRPIPPFGRPMMAQPFVPTIVTEGEVSFLFIDGALSHAVRKTPAAGDYRVQGAHGGQDEAFTPDPDDLESALAVMAALGQPPLYARVDMVRNPSNGRLALMEVEVIEPYLFPEHAPDLGRRVLDGLVRRLSA